MIGLPPSPGSASPHPPEPAQFALDPPWPRVGPADPVVLAAPGPTPARSLIVSAIPHAGRLYPPELVATTVVQLGALRTAEDALIDHLAGPAAAARGPVLICRAARALCDVNRGPEELDPSLFEGPPAANRRLELSARVVAGMGVLPARSGDGRPLYAATLAWAEADRRLRQVHSPYHAAVAAAVRGVRRDRGAAILIDWHSFPSAPRARPSRGAGPDMVLGDRHGRACSAVVTRLARRTLEAMGYRVALNAPYAGGYTTALWGRPAEGLHALQIEIDRSLYLDGEADGPGAAEVGASAGFPLKMGRGFAKVQADLDRLLTALAELEPAALG